ncbi:MAG: DNA polymerase I [Bacteroidales bacterium]|nr:DNA polymerase I [Bacteroidales bacterium]
MKQLFLLDAYALIYRAYYGFINKPLVNSKGLNTGPIYGFLKTLQDVLSTDLTVDGNRIQPTHLAVCFDPKGGTFRHREFPTYKAQREAQPEAITEAVPYIKRLIEAYNIPIIEVADYEADDVIGTLALQADATGEFETFMLTPDKDYAQLVSEHCRIFKPKSFGPGYEILGVPEVLAKYGLKRTEQVIDYLGLMGDSADNIPGCPGVGPKTAQKLIEDFDSIEGIIANVSNLKGALQKKVSDNIQQIKDSKYLATICRSVPCTLDEEALRIVEPNYSDLLALFEEVEFRKELKTLRDKIGSPNAGADNKGKESASSPANSPVKSAPVETSIPETETPLTDISSVKTNYKLCDTTEKIQDLISQLFWVPYFAFDTETTSVNVMDAELVGISFAIDNHEAWYVPIPADQVKAREIVDMLRPILENEAVEKIAQNAKFDYSMLKRYGVEVSDPLFDTMIAHYLLQPEMQHNMDYLSEVYLKYRPIPTSDLINTKAKKSSESLFDFDEEEKPQTMREVPVDKVMQYCCEDSDVTLQLYKVFKNELKKEKLEKLFYEIEMPLVKVLADMELTGVRIDVAALKESEGILNQELKNIEARITELAGHPFNPLSPKAVGTVLFDEMKLDPKAKKTKSGQYTTSEEVLQKLRDKSPIIDEILNYRGVKKLLSTYIEALPQEINHRTGRIHAQFNQTVTATGRLSSSNPNLQNIPIRDELGRELRKAFIPDEGEVFFSADYSQIELRLMAHLSQDPNMTEAFLSGEDIHTATAAKIYHLPVGEVTKLQRTKAKTANFGIIYGISVFGLASRLNIPRSEAKQLIDGYFVTYPKVQEYMNKSIEVAREKGYVETLFGRKRVLADISSANATVRGYAERNAINAPIQGTAADIIKIAMVRIARRIRKEKLNAKLLIQVHDELNFSVPQNELEKLQALVLEEMAGAVKLRVPLIADCGSGSNWLEAH